MQPGPSWAHVRLITSTPKHCGTVGVYTDDWSIWVNTQHQIRKHVFNTHSIGQPRHLVIQGCYWCLCGCGRMCSTSHTLHTPTLSCWLLMDIRSSLWGVHGCRTKDKALYNKNAKTQGHTKTRHTATCGAGEQGVGTLTGDLLTCSHNQLSATAV